MTVIKEQDKWTFLDWAQERFCDKCEHANDCNITYLCPPLQEIFEEWKKEKEE